MSTEEQVAREPLLACPECYTLLRRDQAEHHASTHWPYLIQPYPEHAEAIRRQTMLREFAAQGQR